VPVQVFQHFAFSIAGNRIVSELRHPDLYSLFNEAAEKRIHVDYREQVRGLPTITDC
jgi:hypothetical protein